MLRALAVTVLFAAASPAADPPDGFTPLVGKDLAGWTVVTKNKADGSKTWTFKDGVLSCTGKPTGCLLTEQEYENYTLRLEYRYLPTDLKRPNGGVLLHCQKGDLFWPHSFEVQLAKGEAGDLWLQPDANKKLPKLTTPAEQVDGKNKEGRHFFRLKAAADVEKPVGEWNRLEVTCKADTITVSVNGVPTNRAAGASLTRGRIGLQAEGAAAEYRGVMLKSLAGRE